jgi:signal transduction histidine kinase
MREGASQSAQEGLDRSLVAAAYLIVLAMFFVTQRIFTGISQMPSGVALGLMIAAIALRVIEFIYWRRLPKVHRNRKDHRFAAVSVVWSLALVLPLAIASHESDSPYFGMLMLPILEAAVYFSIRTTIAVATLSALLSIFWVMFGGHFQPPFSVGEMLESATLILMFYIVGTLVWFLMDRVRRREQQLQKHIVELEATRNRLIVEEKLAAVGRLASSIAHEIRNPVAIISSALEASSSNAFDPAERDEMSRVAMVEARRLENLTTDFLSYANLSAAPFERVDLATLAGYVEGIIHIQAMSKGLQVDLKLDDGGHCTVEGNEGQLQQVMLNLMRNAVEASPEKSSVRIRVSSMSPGKAVITIENAGPAIPEHVVDRIFEPFFTNKPGGTGLGLATARRIVEYHRGTLDLERNEDGCLIFAITLPASAMPTVAAEA